MKFNKKNVTKLIDERINYFGSEMDKFSDDGAMLDELKCKQMIYQLTRLLEKIEELKY